jgi:hypothetical protein
VVAFTKAILTRHTYRDVRVFLRGQIVVDTNKPVALVTHIEIAIDGNRIVAHRGVIIIEELTILTLRSLIGAASLATATTAAITTLTVSIALTILTLPITLPVTLLALTTFTLLTAA